MREKQADRASRRRQVRKGRRGGSNIWLWSLPVVVVAVVVIVVVSVVNGRSNNQSNGIDSTQIGQPVPSSVLHPLTQVPQQAWDSAGATGATAPMLVPPTNPVSGGKAQVFYLGGEFCPYCAAERWPLIIALSRFGQFQGLKLMASSSSIEDPNTPTFTFQGSTYTSQYVDLQAVETADRNDQPLETPTTEQQTLFNKYDAPPYVSSQSTGAIPFVLINQRYLWVGASLSPTLFQGKTWQTAADSLANPTGQLGKSIVANANMITATICAEDGGQPTNVCKDAGVQAAAKLLPAPAGS